MRKRIFAACLTLVMVCCVTGCADDSDGMENRNDIGTQTEGADDGSDLEASVNDALKSADEGNLIFDIPEGFVYDEATMLYNSQDGLGNINYRTKDNDGSFSLTTQMLMEMGLESSLSSQLGTEVDITVESWEETEVDGYEALRFSIAYMVDETTVEQTQIVVNGTKKLHYLTFTEMAGADYTEEFTTSEETLRFE